MTDTAADESNRSRLRYEDGTLRLESVDDGLVRELRATVEVEFDPRTDSHRIPAFQYGRLCETLASTERNGQQLAEIVDDDALSLESVTDLESAYTLREYQSKALEAWLETDPDPDSGHPTPHGVLELPTGSGKTVIALKAIERLSVPTLVVVPTIDLLEQWERELRTEFSVPIGRFGGGQQRLEPITVSTYDSAYLKADSVGDRFGLVVFDEVHHLGAEGYREIARLLAAPARLGITATFERPDDAHEVIAELVGPLQYRIEPDELAGDHLAAYDVKRLEVSLTPDEREAYERNQTIFADYLASSNIRMQRGSDYQQLVKRSGSDPEARRALLARQRAREITRGSEAKLTALESILEDHREDRIIVFTAMNELSYEVSERFLIPAITHQTDGTLSNGQSEREYVLDRFREGTYSRLVTTNVLDEGIDVPEASVGVVLSGSGSQREFRQRLGRILRPKADGSRAILYEVVAEDTSEERVADRRRN